MTQQCLPHTGSVKVAAIICGILIPVLILLLIILYKLYRYYDKHRTRKPPKIRAIYVQPSLAISRDRIIAPPARIPEIEMAQLVTQTSTTQVVSPSVEMRASSLANQPPGVVGDPPVISGPRIIAPVGMGPTISSQRPVGPPINGILNQSYLLLPPPGALVGGPPVFRPSPPLNGFNPAPPNRYIGLPINDPSPFNGQMRYNGEQPVPYGQANRRSRAE